MKSVKIALVALAVVAAIVYAAKVPTVFAPGLEGFATPAVTPEVTETNGYTVVDFGTQLGTAGKLQFTKVDGENIIVKVETVKSVGQKGGKVTGKLNGIATSDPDLQVKMKGITVGTIWASGVKKVQVAALTTMLNAGNFSKGTSVKAVNSIGGTLTGNFKSVACGWFENTDASTITTPKKLNLKAKANMGGVVKLPAGIVYKAKNVTVE